MIWGLPQVNTEVSSKNIESVHSLPVFKLRCFLNEILEHYEWEFYGVVFLGAKFRNRIIFCR
jgi:hypothetical protein